MHKKFDLIAIGGGSGGIATVNKAAHFGAKCALIEASAIGGTCVNVGCVPKKLTWLASAQAMLLNESEAFGLRAKISAIDWPYFVQKRQAYIERLHQGYINKLNSNGVTLIKGSGSFVSPSQVKVGDDIFEAKHIIIATGGKPALPDIPGKEHAIDSDGFFALQTSRNRLGTPNLEASTKASTSLVQAKQKFSKMVQQDMGDGHPFADNRTAALP